MEQSYKQIGKSFTKISKKSKQVRFQQVIDSGDQFSYKNKKRKRENDEEQQNSDEESQIPRQDTWDLDNQQLESE